MIVRSGRVRPEKLEKLLGQLGFAFEGRHRTKDVQLWTMGEARVIINEQAPDGAAAPAIAAGIAAGIAALGFDVAFQEIFYVRLP